MARFDGMSVEFREAPVDNERVSLRKPRIADYLRPKTLTMLLLGFSSGLPFFLVAIRSATGCAMNTPPCSDRGFFPGWHCIFAEVSVGP